MKLLYSDIELNGHSYEFMNCILQDSSIIFECLKTTNNKYTTTTHEFY